MLPRSKLNIFLLTAVLATFAGNVWAQCVDYGTGLYTIPIGTREYINNSFKICIDTRWVDLYCQDATWDTTLRRYWKLDEPSGVEPLDTIGANTTIFDMGASGAQLPGFGYRDGSVLFDGAITYINAGGNTTTDIDDLFAGNGLSISAWIYPVDLGENSNGTIISKNNGTGGTPANGWTFRLTNTGGINRIEFVADYAGTDLTRRSATSAITLNAWNHVVLTWTGSATATNAHIYVNGGEVTYATTTNGTSTRSSDAASDMIIGNNRVTDLSRTFNGAMDEVYVFSGIVSGDDILQLYGRGCEGLRACGNSAEIEYNGANFYEYCDGNYVINLGCPETSSAQSPVLYEDPTANLLGWWKLDESSGTFADSSGNGWTGTQYNGGPTYQPNFGRISGSAFFNTNDANPENTQPHIDLGTGFTIPTQPYTITAWVNPTDYNDYRTIIGKRSSFPSDQRFLWLLSSGGGQVRLLGDAFDTTFAYGPPTSTWTHLAVVSTTTETTLYVNGEIQEVGAAVALTGGVAAHASIGGNGEIQSGGYDEDPYKGYLDDVRVYSGALNGVQIKTIYEDSLDNGLVARWKLDETSGTNAADASGHSVTGTLTNGPVWQPGPGGGRIGGALNFDGTDDYVDFTSTAANALRNVSAASVSMWVKPETNANYSLIGFSVGGVGATPASRFTIETYGSNDLEVGGRAADGEAFSPLFTPANALPLHRWSHVVGIVDYANNDIFIYVNGELVASTFNSGFTQTSTANTSSGSVALGAEDDGSALSFDGQIDDVRVYNRVLTQGEVTALLKQAGPLGWWKLDETSGNAADSSGRGFTGTPVNSPTWAPSGGKVNGALQMSFGTIDDENKPHLDLGTDFDIGGPPYTLTAWVNPADYADWHTIIGKRVTSADERFLFQMIDVSGRIRVYGNFAGPVFNYAPPLGTWTHLAAVAKTTGTDLYVNGALLETSPYVVGAAISGIPGHANIGDNGENDSFALAPSHDGDPWEGSLDDIRAYDRPLNAGEIKAIYNEGRPDNIVAWWKLDESTGTTAVDSVGGFDCDMVGDHYWLPDSGAVNGGLGFVGGGDCEYNDSGTIALDFASGGITISGWAYALSGFNGTYRNIIAKGDASPSTDYNFALQLNNDDQIHFFYSNGWAFHEYASTDAQYFADQWVHYAFTYTYGTGSSAKLYVNGILVPGFWRAGNGNAAAAPNNAALAIGSAGPGVFEPWYGVLDDLRIYNTVLTPAQIYQLYKTSTPGECQSLGACTKAGAIEYDTVNWILKWCNGSEWLPMARY